MGQKFAAKDAQGNLGFYDSVDSPLPEDATDAVAITDEEWEAAKVTPGYAIMNGVFTPPSADVLLEQARVQQIAVLRAAYNTAIQQPVSYTSKAGVTKGYQTDSVSVSNLSQMILAFQATGAVPDGFYWVAADNTQVPFTYADLQGLAQAMGAQGAAAFQKFQTLKVEVAAAATIAAVQAIDW
ncbi:DUF4376 domain-containing protein [Paraburkholderia sp. BR14263]|uniref:DUF4376 domain-containing protein n=1 Tax=unclassified Paraburkholderia TaxID=2615204 RepID=UPI0034CECB78